MRAAQVHEVNYQTASPEKHNTRSMAQSWGMWAAGKGLDIEKFIADEVEAEFHEVARKAYALKLQNLARGRNCR